MGRPTAALAPVLLGVLAITTAASAATSGTDAVSSCPGPVDSSKAATGRPQLASAGVLLMQRPQLHVTKVGARAPTSMAEHRAQQPTAVEEELQSLKAEVQTLNGWLQDTLATLKAKAGSCCCNGAGTDPGTNVSDHTYTTTDTTTTTLPRPNLCSAFGDPHFITFDGAQTTFVGDMVLWLVRSQDVWIQGLSKESEGKLMGVAVGGPFMQGHTLAIYNTSEAASLHVLLDGEPILNETISEYHLPGVLDGSRTDSWDPSKFNSDILNLRTRATFDIGDFPSRFAGSPAGGLYLLRLPNGIDLTVSGVDYMSTVIAMAADPTGQSGYCGNFNSDPDDDAETVVPSWDRAIGKDLDAVPEEMNLFKSGQVLSLLGLKDSFGHGAAEGQRSSGRKMSKVLEECKDDLRKQAEERCAGVMSKAFQRSCIFDICLTGQLGASEDILTAEIMQEHVNARGVPKFIGHGECLDAEGRRFRSFTTNLRTDRACKDLLRQLATTKGVLGAQLRRGQACQVLVEQGTDPTGTMIPEGWAEESDNGSTEQPTVDGVGAAGGDSVVVSGLGHGLVSQASGDAGWNCWQLI